MSLFTSLFKLSIRFYWLIVPNKIKGVCLFKESCSKYVYRKLTEDGFKAGVKALRYRIKTCRQPYVIRKNIYSNEFENLNYPIIKFFFIFYYKIWKRIV